MKHHVNILSFKWSDSTDIEKLQLMQYFQKTLKILTLADDSNFSSLLDFCTVGEYEDILKVIHFLNKLDLS